MHLIGKKSTLTTEIADTIVRIVSLGNYAEIAAQAAGVPVRTFHDWMARARSQSPDDGAYRSLKERIGKAKAEGEAALVATLTRDSRTNPATAQWLLERQAPDRWARISQRPAEAEAPEESDPFAEVDELAERRKRDAV